ncbi:unnamed protein product [marine sediment metagenome]|uniref:Uncharacterized protein n=1 Tax=marine sediment metagenome TaxID=412755 RepID=X1TF56_9ZZZZ
MTGEVVISPEKNWPDESAEIVRGDQADLPLNVAFVGGGKACYDLLQMLDNERLSRLKMKILGVADIDPLHTIFPAHTSLHSNVSPGHPRKRD